MAMVYQSDKKTNTTTNNYINNENYSPGPGTYNIQHSYKQTLNDNQINNNHAPFGFSEKASLKKIETTPGPGEYFENNENHLLNSYFIRKFNKNEVKSLENKEKNMPLYKYIQLNSSLNNKFLSKVNKKGFSYQEERFKSPIKNKYKLNFENEMNNNQVNKSFDILVFNEGRKNNEKTSFKTKKMSPIQSKQIIELLKNDNLNNNISIPYRDNCFGFEVSANGKIVSCTDPLQYRKYKGNSYDSVGPGQYNIDSNWINEEKAKAKGKEKKSKLNKTKQSKEMKYFQNKSNENISSSCININNTTISQTAINSNRKKQMTSENKGNNKNSNQKMKIIKTINAYRQEIFGNISQSQGLYKTLNKKNFDDTPGPGYYFDQKNFGFKMKSTKEEFQSFGSSSLRFKGRLDENSNIGPGCYFNEEKDFEINKNNEYIKKYKNYHKNYSNSIDKASSSIIQSIIKEKNSINNPGPGAYSINREILKESNPNKKGIFGSSEKRFIEKEPNDLPIAYNDNSKNEWIKFNNENKDNRSIKPITSLNQLEQKKEISNKIINENKEDVPSVGTYNPDKIFSIDYKISKQTRQSSFSSLSKRFNEQKQSDIGPGYYYRNMSMSKEILSQNQKNAPFLSNQKRINEEGSKEKGIVKESNVGPGYYNLNSYFDWNKKSYNVQFI